MARSARWPQRFRKFLVPSLPVGRQFPDFLRMCRRKILCFSDIFGEIVEFRIR